MAKATYRIEFSNGRRIEIGGVSKVRVRDGVLLVKNKAGRVQLATDTYQLLAVFRVDVDASDADDDVVEVRMIGADLSSPPHRLIPGVVDIEIEVPASKLAEYRNIPYYLLTSGDDDLPTGLLRSDRWIINRVGALVSDPDRP